MAVMAEPANVQTSLALMHELVDGIWAAAGDQSSDSTWYTKRMALQVVYTTTELYMLTDFSPGHADTWSALDRRMEDVKSVGQGLKRAEMALLELHNRITTFGR
jgi:ubiquinone biosynthesis protein COQ9